MFNGPINGEAFRARVAQMLVAELSPRDIVVMDNLGSYKGAETRDLIRTAGARLWFLPPYSPDLNPIEQTFAKFKQAMRTAQKRTVAAVTDQPARSPPRSYPSNATTTSSTPDMLSLNPEPL